MTHPDETFVEVPAGRLAVLDFGGQGPDILLVHEVTSNALVWVGTATALTSIGHVVAVDLPGHGHSGAVTGGDDPIFGPIVDAARALGLHRPLVVGDGSDVVSGDPHRFDALDPVGYVLIGELNVRRGLDAREEFAELEGDAGDVWAERFGLFATGRAADRAAYVDGVCRAAAEDWATRGFDPDRWRAYVERGMDDSPDGWRRLPERATYDRYTAAALDGPLGLDLYDALDAPLLLVSSESETSTRELGAMDDFAVGRDDREVATVEGGVIPELLDARQVTRAVQAFLERHATAGAAAGRA